MQQRHEHRLARILRHVSTPSSSATAAASSAKDPAGSQFSASSDTRPPMDQSSQRLPGKVCVVIGASSQVRDDISIGKATAIQFAREGAQVVAVARSQDGLDSVVEACEAEGGQCDSVACDATDGEAVKAMIATVISRYGRIDVLHHNLGGGGGKGTAATTEEDWEFGMKLNAFSPFICMKYVLPHMVENGGGVITTTSSVMGSRALVGRPNVPYQMSKAALESLTWSTAAEYASRGIRVNCISPGLMWGPIVYGTIADNPELMVKLVSTQATRVACDSKSFFWQISRSFLCFPLLPEGKQGQRAADEGARDAVGLCLVRGVPGIGRVAVCQRPDDSGGRWL